MKYYGESEYYSFEFVICKYIVVHKYKVNKMYLNSKMIVENWFQRLNG